MARRNPLPPFLRRAPQISAPAPQIPVEPAAISAPLVALSENWPEGLRLEIRQSNLANAQVLLPANLIEPALKRGRIIFTWRNLRPLIKPLPPPASIHDGTELELPLNVIAPLFFARQKTAPRSQAMERPPAEIPNLFFGFPQPETLQAKSFRNLSYRNRSLFRNPKHRNRNRCRQKCPNRSRNHWQ